MMHATHINTLQYDARYTQRKIKINNIHSINEDNSFHIMYMQTQEYMEDFRSCFLFTF